LPTSIQVTWNLYDLRGQTVRVVINNQAAGGAITAAGFQFE